MKGKIGIATASDSKRTLNGVGIADSAAALLGEVLSKIPQVSIRLDPNISPYAVAVQQIIQLISLPADQAEEQTSFEFDLEVKNSILLALVVLQAYHSIPQLAEIKNLLLHEEVPLANPGIVPGSDVFVLLEQIRDNLGLFDFSGVVLQDVSEEEAFLDDEEDTQIDAVPDFDSDTETHTELTALGSQSGEFRPTTLAQAVVAIYEAIQRVQPGKLVDEEIDALVGLEGYVRETVQKLNSELQESKAEAERLREANQQLEEALQEAEEKANQYEADANLKHVAQTEAANLRNELINIRPKAQRHDSAIEAQHIATQQAEAWKTEAEEHERLKFEAIQDFRVMEKDRDKYAHESGQRLITIQNQQRTIDSFGEHKEALMQLAQKNVVRFGYFAAMFVFVLLLSAGLGYLLSIHGYGLFQAPKTKIVIKKVKVPTIVYREKVRFITPPRARPAPQRVLPRAPIRHVRKRLVKRRIKRRRVRKVRKRVRRRIVRRRVTVRKKPVRRRPVNRSSSKNFNGWQ